MPWARPGSDFTLLEQATIKAFSVFLAEYGGDSDNVVEVVCDMSQAFLSGVAENLPNAEVTVDGFPIG